MKGGTIEKKVSPETMEEKIRELTWIWCEWNSKETDGDAAMSNIERLFKEECLEAWNNPKGWKP